MTECIIVTPKLGISITKGCKNIFNIDPISVYFGLSMALKQDTALSS